MHFKRWFITAPLKLWIYGTIWRQLLVLKSSYSRVWQLSSLWALLIVSLRQMGQPLFASVSLSIKRRYDTGLGTVPGPPLLQRVWHSAVRARWAGSAWTWQKIWHSREIYFIQKDPIIMVMCLFEKQIKVILLEAAGRNHKCYYLDTDFFHFIFILLSLASNW